jgi:nucleotide-binding universal stress UspA family protein
VSAVVSTYGERTRGFPDSGAAARRQARRVFKTVVWATDGSETSQRALPYARALANGGRLVVVHVCELLVGRLGGQPAYSDDDDTERAIREQVEGLREEGVDVSLQLVTTLDTNAAPALAKAASQANADVIVVGTRGNAPLAGLVLGSVTQRLLHLAPCPVFAVPPVADRLTSHV